MSVTCPNCSGEYTQIANHWTNNYNCEAPDLTPYQKQVIIGCLMGDGSFQVPRSVQITMTNIDYLEWLSDELGVIACDVCDHTTASGQAEKSHSLERLSDDPTHYSDVYVVRTRSIDEIEELYEKWQTDDGKIIPSDLDLTPTSVGHWYVGDGCLDYSGKVKDQSNARIKAEFMQGKLNRIQSMFNDIGFNPTITEQGSIQIPTEETDGFLEWIDGPFPGFEYKWENESESAYHEKKDSVRYTQTIEE